MTTTTQSVETPAIALQSRAGTRTVRPGRIGLQLLLFGIPASLFYAWFITAGTFALFGAERHGLAYGSLLLHILHGRFEVDRYTIGLEGLFIEDRVYLSYGVLPALLRVPFLPFVDLSQVTVSRIVVLALTIPAAAIWHYLLLQVIEPYRLRFSAIAFGLMRVVAAIFAWLISPSFALSVTAPIYHETVTPALLLTAIYTLIVWQVVQRGGQMVPRLPWLAVVAALSLHARIEVAIGLYIGTGLFTLLTMWRAWSPARPLREAIASAVAPAIAPMSILLASGVLYLWMDRVRQGAQWGYYLYVDGFAAEARQNAGLGLFNVVRIPINLVAYLLSSEEWTDALRSALGAGVGRMLEPPSPMLLLWAAPLMLVAIGCLPLKGADGPTRREARAEFMILALALAVPDAKVRPALASIA